MRLLAVALLCACPTIANTFSTRGVDAASWSRIAASIGLQSTARESAASVIVLGANEPALIEELAEKHLVIVEGFGAAARSLGFTAGPETVPTRHIVDTHNPSMPILWSDAVAIPSVHVPAGYQVFAAERWKQIPVMAGKRVGNGGILWLATSPGPTGIERFPYLLQAAADLGLETPARTVNLWAFFDSAYRIRADVDYLASRWREAGISALHVAAWHNMESDPIQDAYLSRLIEACHRHGVLVYAWLELPHVSEKFWADHPAWREKTAIGQDAQLDWRKLMNLENADCRRAVQQLIARLLSRFDWDGVNLAELYFESLEGAGNPARFTPMNEEIRSAFQQQAGFDPKLLFDPGSEHSAAKDPNGLRRFLDFRASLTARMQTTWLQVLDESKQSKPYLDIALTHIDDRFEPGIRDALGADVARTLPVLQQRRETLLVEDPATLWNLGPDRYAKLAASYAELTPQRGNLAVDINVVERYQDVYPTKKQTGVELLELVHQAAASFRRVALYFENSLENTDLALLPVAASTTQAQRVSPDEWRVEGIDAARIPWSGPAALDGRLWPLQSTGSVLVPAGTHTLSPAFERCDFAIADFNGVIQSANTTPSHADISYQSKSRAIARMTGKVTGVEIDGTAFPFQAAGDGSIDLLLPAGQHVLTVSSAGR